METAKGDVEHKGEFYNSTRVHGGFKCVKIVSHVNESSELITRICVVCVRERDRERAREREEDAFNREMWRERERERQRERERERRRQIPCEVTKLIIESWVLFAPHHIHGPS